MKMSLPIFALFIGAFCVGTSEFVIAGLLPEISSDLAITIPTAGLLVTVYAIGVALGGPLVTIAIAKLQHRISLCLLMILFTVGQVICVVAPNFTGVMAGRVVVALCHGSFYGIANVVIIGLVPTEKRGSAVAMLFAGITLANIIGVPLGTAIGGLHSWRATFFVLAILGAIVVCLLWFALPDGKSDKKKTKSISAQISAMKNQMTLYAFYMFAITRFGFWCLFTFISPFLFNISNIPESRVPLALLLFGIGALFGTLGGGKLVDRFPDQALQIMLPLQILGFLLMMFSGFSEASVLAGMLFFGFVFFMPSSAMVNRILAGASAAPELAGTLISSVANIGIALGALLGSFLLASGMDYSALPLLGVVFALTAIVAFNRSAYLEKQALT